MEKTPLTVSDSIALINQTLDYAYPVLVVEGEISSFKVNRDKYVFFDLKDEASSLGCFMTVWQLRMPLEDGMKVQVVARPGLTQWGKFSLTVREVRPVGEGSLKRSFELLKQKLEQEGLFALERKRQLPRLPHRIGVIASAESAGYIDFLTILGARWGGIDIQVANVQVQGAGAAEQVVRALEFFNQQSHKVEVLVIVRGGGSADDLAVFNDEPLVRAVAASSIPTLVGIGHELDVSLVDLAADVRAATPSNAAERLVPDRREILQHVSTSSERLSDRLDRRLDGIRDTLADFPSVIERLLKRRLDIMNQQLVQHQRLLEQLSPQAALRRGYGLLRTADGSFLSPARQAKLKKGDQLQIELAKRIVNVGVHDVTDKR